MKANTCSIKLKIEPKKGKPIHDKVVNRKAHMIKSYVPVTLWECMSTLEISPRGCHCKLVAFPNAGVMFFGFTSRDTFDLVLPKTTTWKKIHMLDQIKNGTKTRQAHT